MAILKHLVGFGLFLGIRAFRIYEDTDLDNYDVGDACVSALSADIACHPEIHSFLQPSYRGSLENVTLTDEICTGTCSASLRKWFNTVSNDCAGKSDEFNGNPPTRYGGYVWAGWNETCVKDPKTKKYCNDIIDGFSDVKDGESLPHAELCHVCYLRRLAMMQSSQYSIYDEYYKEELELVYKTCGGSGPTDIPPPLKEGEMKTEFCMTSKYYTTVEGDTCDSISKASGVSGAFLYMSNQEAVGDCREVPAGLRLCLPMTCKTYYVQPDDTCFGIETSLGIRWDDAQYYNSWVNRDCSNLQTATDFYGRSICISPLGDTSSATKASSIQRKISSGNGPTVVRIPSPRDAKVAEGTTLNCGKWHVTTKSDTCDEICKANDICEGTLMFDINPSLVSKEQCTANLVPGMALCMAPISGWNVTIMLKLVPNYRKSEHGSHLTEAAVRAPNSEGDLMTTTSSAEAGVEA
ncbi:hypothetical protein AK830_g2384 [Neonectria ditissima]|uniref:LysM domain-containing protein n=1 Tax=Neonectria ditissima TaxID=78410 RepID=A0A0P7BS03_9HYPO|nr:hypothetical protein AK830_g2384 [Neonectria ditissima]